MADLEDGGPGVAVAVVKDGSVLHRKGYGLADLEWGAAIEPDTVLALGSLTKPITAMSVLLLEKQGRLSIDDPITAYLPDYPTHGHMITIAHLLMHTSGIPNYVTMPGFFPNEARKDLSPDELSKLFRDLPFEVEVVLRELVELDQVTRAPLEAIPRGDQLAVVRGLAGDRARPARVVPRARPRELGV